jgi:hypothetical protein
MLTGDFRRSVETPRAGSAAPLAVAADAVLGPGQSLQALRRNGLSAVLAQPVAAIRDAPEGALNQAEMLLLALAQLLAALAFRYLAGGGSLRPVGDPGVLDLLGEYQENPSTLRFERPPR